MDRALSRRRVVTWGAAGAALPLIGSQPAGAQELSPDYAPGRFFDVTKFGAKGDGRTIDTAAINHAIDAAAVHGGTVYFPAGTYASYSIHLKSNVALYLAANATILAAAPAGGKGYDPAEPGAGNPYQDFGHSHWHNSLIWGENLENVTIEGPGKIDGKGLVAGGSTESAPLNGNKAIALKLCRNVAIRDLTIVNGGHFAHPADRRRQLPHRRPRDRHQPRRHRHRLLQERPDRQHHGELAQRRRDRAEELVRAQPGAGHGKRHHRQLLRQRLRPRHAARRHVQDGRRTDAPAASSSAPRPTAGSATSRSRTWSSSTAAAWRSRRSTAAGWRT